MQVIDKIIDDGKTFLGYKYRERVAPGYVFDCSGYVSYIFSKNNIQLARSSAAMAKDVHVVPLEETRAGDLLFFKGQTKNNKPRTTNKK